MFRRVLERETRWYFNKSTIFPSSEVIREKTVHPQFFYSRRFGLRTKGARASRKANDIPISCFIRSAPSDLTSAHPFSFQGPIKVNMSDTIRNRLITYDSIEIEEHLLRQRLSLVNTRRMMHSFDLERSTSLALVTLTRHR